MLAVTFEVQVLGTIDHLADGLGVHLEGVGVGGVTGDDHTVPLVVVEGAIAVALQKARAIAQVEDIVDEPR